jgi:hypothetical protein
MNKIDLNPPQQRTILGWFLLIIGFISIALGVVGIFLPVLPTVPFLLLSLACFARSSDRFSNWLLNHNHLGPLIQPYLQGQGIPRAAKFKAIALLWTSIGFSVVFLLELIWVKVLLLIIAVAVTVYLQHLPATQTSIANIKE